jgi:arylsulfatase A-like enzyme
MTDQQRWDALGVLNPRIKTPNLDRLAKAGVVYRQATCQAPMCVPSRNSLMFGLYPSQLGIRSNSSHSLGDSLLPFDPLPAQLRRAGYQTAGFGKTHWGRIDEEPSTRGFETRVVGAKEVGQEQGAIYQDSDDPEGLAAYHRETADYGPGEEGVPGYIGCTSSVPQQHHRDGWVADQCLEFLEGGVDPQRPLFLYLSFLKPHAGFNVPKQFEDLYRIEDIPDIPQPPWAEESGTHLAYCDQTNTFLGPRYRTWRAAWAKMTPMERRRTTLRYFANCSWLESYFGQALDRLQALGRLDNALIVYTSDHGEMLSERNFRFSKYCLFESSVRVPIILSGSVIPTARRGVVDDRPAELVDLFATLLGVAGANAPQGIQGFDLLNEPKRQASFCEFHDAGAPAYMWRTPEWKLILFMDRPLADATSHLQDVRGELYDLRNDPHEWNNLYGAAAQASVREQMKTQLLMHLACALEAFPVARG